MSTDPYGGSSGAAGHGTSSGSERLDVADQEVDDLRVVRRPENAGRTTNDTHGGADVGDVSLGTLVGNLTGDLSRLMRAELALAKAEAKEEVAVAGKGAGMLAGAGVGAHMVLVFASLALMFALGSFMPIGWGALVVAVLWAAVAAVLAATGRKNLQRAAPPLQETVETLKEDAQWAKRPRG